MSERWPDFLIVGAARSGTSALFALLGQHPEIFTSPLKEPHFFSLHQRRGRFQGPGDDVAIDRRRITEKATYLNLFSSAGPRQLTCEASVSYLYYPEASVEVKRWIPDVRIIVVMRNPIERAFSNYQYMLALAREPSRSFEEALALEEARIAANWEHIWHYRNLGYYYRQLKRFYEIFPPDRILPLVYDDFRASPETVLRAVFRFLGVDEDVSIDFNIRVNVSGRPRSAALARLLVRPTPLKRAILHYVPPGLRLTIASALRTRLLQKEFLAEGEAAWLREEYRAELIALAELIGRDLGAWLGEPELARAGSALAPR